MKQRIEKLVEQAGIWKPTHDHKTWVRGEYVASPGELEKFAELIVRECAKALDDKLANPNGASMAYCDGSDLLEHFGVEE